MPVKTAVGAKKIHQHKDQRVFFERKVIMKITKMGN